MFCKLLSYIEIQNIRYPNKVIYSYECEESLKQISVPKLIIQPLVENAFEHAYNNKGIYKLDIIVEEDEREIDIIVTDNGRGMSEEEINYLNESLQNTDVYQENKSIGLLNVNQRIRGIYGIKILSTNDDTIFPKAEPIITPIAISITFPLEINSLNSFNINPPI